MADVAELVIRIDAATETFRRELKRAEGDVKTFEGTTTRSLRTVDASFKSLSSGMGQIRSAFSAFAAFAAVQIGVKAVNAIGAAVDAIGSLGETAQQLGVTTKTLQAFHYAATQVGISADDMDAGLAKLSKSIGEAAEGAKTQIDAFEKLGVKILDAGGKVRSTDAILVDIAGALQKIDDPARRVAIGVDLFGKGFQKLIPFLSEGAAGLQAFYEQADRAGVILSDDTIKKADAAADAISAFTFRIDNMAKRIGANMAIAFTPFLTWLDEVQQSAAADSAFDQLNIKIVVLKNSIAKLQERVKNQQDTIAENPAWQMAGAARAQIAGDLKEIEALEKELSPLLEQAATSSTGHRNAPSGADTAPQGVSNPKSTSDVAAEEAAAKAATKAALALHQKIEQMEIEAGLAAEKKESDREQQALDDERADTMQMIADLTAAANTTEAEGVALKTDLMTAQEKYNAELERYSVLLATNAIDKETYDRAAAASEEALTGTADFAHRAKDALVDFGQSASNALEELIVSGGKAKDMFRSLAEQAAKMALQTAVFTPLQGAFSSLLTGAFGFAGGGIMSKHGSVPLNRYAGGGVASSPQLAMFGEGSKPEAYVPLPDGRSIPVTMKGATGGGVVVNTSITVNGGAGDEKPAALANRIAAQVNATVEQAVARVISRQQRPGGMLSQSAGA